MRKNYVECEKIGSKIGKFDSKNEKRGGLEVQACDQSGLDKYCVSALSL